jgi:hypothetical protein
VTIVLVATGDYVVLGNKLQTRQVEILKTSFLSNILYELTLALTFENCENFYQMVACVVISVGGIIYASNDAKFHLVEKNSLFFTI